MEMAMVKELLLQSLEHEMGGVKVYETALKCVVNEDLKEEWEKYHQETERHVQICKTCSRRCSSTRMSRRRDARLSMTWGSRW